MYLLFMVFQSLEKKVNTVLPLIISPWNSRNLSAGTYWEIPGDIKIKSLFQVTYLVLPSNCILSTSSQLETVKEYEPCLRPAEKWDLPVPPGALWLRSYCPGQEEGKPGHWALSVGSKGKCPALSE